MRLISAVSGVQLPAPPPFFRFGVHQGVEREWGADRTGRISATHGSASAPRPAAEAEALAGRRLRRAIPCTAPPFPHGDEQGVERAYGADRELNGSGAPRVAIYGAITCNDL